MLELPRPRFVEVRRLADGSVAFYFCIPKYYRNLGCEIANEPLSANYETARGEDGKGVGAATLNTLSNESNAARTPHPPDHAHIAPSGPSHRPPPQSHPAPPTPHPP